MVLNKSQEVILGTHVITIILDFLTINYLYPEYSSGIDMVRHFWFYGTRIQSLPGSRTNTLETCMM